MELVIHNHNQTLTTPNDIRVYINGSVRDGKAGGTTVFVVQNEQAQHINFGGGYYLGIYDTELLALVKVLELLPRVLTTAPYSTAAHLFSDNESAIRSICKSKPKSGQCFSLRAIATLNNQNQFFPQLKIIIHWVPRHQNITGNEAIDKLTGKPPYSM
ncbi:hypothetical protein R1flu_016926 [Riccia fluitans]|uniref:RNase H type-1 domain-containing protein n=1 Tax=Riccia fluitans TaxID=41844 RepID=A0ABD1YNB9_9MARC